MTSRRADILVRTRSGRRLALVEVKNLPRLSERDALDLRDALAQDSADAVPYVMVVSQSVGYLWQLQAERSGGMAEYGQAQVLDMKPVIREYLGEAELSRHLRGAELDLVLSYWLGDLARGRTDVMPTTREPGPLTSFVADIRDAQVELEARA